MLGKELTVTLGEMHGRYIPTGKINKTIYIYIYTVLRVNEFTPFEK